MFSSLKMLPICFLANWKENRVSPNTIDGNQNVVIHLKVIFIIRYWYFWVVGSKLIFKYFLHFVPFFTYSLSNTLYFHTEKYTKNECRLDNNNNLDDVPGSLLF